MSERCLKRLEDKRDSRTNPGNGRQRNYREAGKPIKYPQIYEILRNEKYTGVYTYSPQEEKNRGDRRTKPKRYKN